MGRAIGVFDSGVGGLTVLRAIREKLPHEATVYLGDTARVPYGSKSPEVVARYSLNNARFLLQHDLKLLVVACNTATAHALPALQAALTVPVIGVVEPGAQVAAALTRNGRIGVIGTAGTIASGAYQRALEAAAPGATVFASACPLFVPLAEEGWTSGDLPRAVAERYLGALRGSVDTLVLGCTHYPLLRGAIAEVMGPGVTLVDSAQATAAAVAERLAASGDRETGGDPSHLLYVTDIPAQFPSIAEAFLGSRPEHVEQVDV
ncbi:glutamate racemase [Vulgatibacter incomptus]|uniref:Glutamate racemase n=1 Tax=Vulgatibacter incomptus TaxID=1391653 RepID=A0A0K1PAA0_9BACT|nr:glutamate racemase [Vulgatibacter incomptus]AKU90341.1 Glutamate racemase [Vulgatibacter incomptus]